MERQMTIFDAMAEKTRKPKKVTQEQKVLDYMRRFGSITPVQAFADLAVMRLGARIYDLEKAGVRIHHGSADSLNRFGEKVSYACYSLMEAADD